MGKGVLIVDDAAFMRMVIRDILEKNGYEVAGEAKDGKEAVAVYKEKQPALVLLDITMPEMDGIAALKHMILLQRLLCVPHSDSPIWSLSPFRSVQKIIL